MGALVIPVDLSNSLRCRPVDCVARQSWVSGVCFLRGGLLPFSLPLRLQGSIETEWQTALHWSSVLVNAGPLLDDVVRSLTFGVGYG